MTSDQTTSVMLALVAGLPTTLTVILAAWLASRRSKTLSAQVNSVADQTIAGAAKIDVVAAKTEEVHSMVNSRLSEALAEIERLRVVVEGQRDTIRDTGVKPAPLPKGKMGERNPGTETK